MNIKTPYFGAAYYPEAWPEGTIEQDIPLMKQAGMNVMRMGEFTWIHLEPKPGQFDFGWLRRAIDRFAENEIATVLATPSATPPVWLTKKHPEILSVDDNGRPRQHGERCHWCPNQPVYREYVAKIVESMAKEFGGDPNVMAWQIDNEPYPNRRGCCCPVCVAKFRERLKEKFGTVENLNATWGTNLWSQRYESFDDFDAPRSEIWHHPSLITEWMRFQSDSYIGFVVLQIEILRRHTGRPIGTDTMPMVRLNYPELAKSVDLMMFNHYPNEGGLRHSQFWLSYVSQFKKRPFWVTESSVNNSSATAVPKAKGYRNEGFVKPLSWLPAFMGGEGNLYWLWRCHWSGQELTHGAVVSSSGRPDCAFDEVVAVGQGFSRVSEFLNTTRPVKPKIALHFSCDTALTYEAQPLIDRFQYEDFYFQRGPCRGELYDSFFIPLSEEQYAVDVIDPSIALDGYEVIITPMLLSLDQSGLRERLKTWIENGGTWVAGPMTDIRTADGTKYTNSPFGSLEEWTGAFCKWQIIGNMDDALFDVQWADGTQSGGRIWYDAFEAPENAEVLGLYANARLAGKVAAFSVPFGKGKIVVLGTVPTREGLRSLLASPLAAAKISPLVEASENILFMARSGEGGSGLTVAEIGGKTGEFTLVSGMTDLLTGKMFKAGRVEVAPYEVMVLSAV
jgi:beta-galactosidase GanA